MVSISVGKNNAFKTAVLAILAFVPAVFSQPRFSVANLLRIPGYEYYEFEGTGNKVDELPVVIRYRVRHAGKENASWRIESAMKLRNTLVEEEYDVAHRQLLVTRYRRTQSFTRGVITTEAKLDIDVETDDPNEFIVGTIPGLMYLLRTFPFHSGTKEFRVRAPQQTRGHLNLRVLNKGRKSLKTASFGTIAVWHLEVSLMVPVVGAILPKLNYYFRDDPQKTLVAMKGVLPATGGSLDVELREYRTERRKESPE